MPHLEAGKRLADRYVLLDRLGDGGHAEVWAARDESTGHRIALKFMHLHSCSAEDAALVLRHEAQMAHRLEHPGVLRIEDPQRDGRLVFLPMEFAGGGDASQLRGAPWQRVLPVLMQVAQVLEHAHSRGVVHRDIKPGNVLFDVRGNVRVTDFGTASRTGSTAAMSAGSPLSASPQQLLGDAATTADDVYGLGALACELLTRHPPNVAVLDPQREGASRAQPVQPVPQELLDLVHAMLARESTARPDLQQVMQGFELLLGSRVAPAVAAAQAPARAPGILRRLRWFGAVAGVGALVWLLLRAVAPAPVPVEQWRSQGAALEQGEQWQAAVAHYQFVLSRDASLMFAQDGLIRSNRRAALDGELAGYLARPERLSAHDIRAAAVRALARGEASSPRARRLANQLAQLRAVLQMLPAHPTSTI